MKDKSKNKEIIKGNQVVTKKQKMIAFVYRIWNDDLALRAFVKKKMPNWVFNYQYGIFGRVIRVITLFLATSMWQTGNYLDLISKLKIISKEQGKITKNKEGRRLQNLKKK